jgi:hypothetical protein
MIVYARGLPACLFSRPQRREQKSRQYRNNSDDNQQLNQCEPSGCFRRSQGWGAHKIFTLSKDNS